jgi:hypothetical protein
MGEGNTIDFAAPLYRYDIAVCYFGLATVCTRPGVQL